MSGILVMDNLGDDLEDLSFSEWPDPPGSHPWLPAYGYQPSQDHQLEKEDFLDPADAALFLGNSAVCGSATGLPPFLETIVEETSEELHSEDGSSNGWMDSDTESVIHVNKNREDCDSGSERDFLCPAKRRRPNQLRPDCPPSPSDSASFLSLSRSSSLAQFESLEQSCQLLEASAPTSPLSILSLDSLERLRVPDVYPDSLENSSDSERVSSSSQESAYRIRLDNLEEELANDLENEHCQDRSLPEQGFGDKTYVVISRNGNKMSHNPMAMDCTNYFPTNGDIRYWNVASDVDNRESSSSEFSSGESDKTVQEDPTYTIEPVKFNFKSCRSLDAMSSIENLEGTKIDNSYAPSNKRQAFNRQVSAQYSAENLSEDSGYSDNFCNILRMKSKSISNVNDERQASERSSVKSKINNALKRKSEDNLPSMFNAKCLKKSEIDSQFGVGGKFTNKKTKSPDVTASVAREGKAADTKINSSSSSARLLRPSPSLPDLRSRRTISDFDKYFNPKQARNTFPRSLADKLAKLLDKELVFDASDANLYSVSSVPKDLNLCDVPDSHTSIDDNWSFGTERVVTSVAAKNFDLGDLNFSTHRSHKVIHDSSFKQSFRVCESFTTSVADLTVLDYRMDLDGVTKNVLKKNTSISRSEKSFKMPRNLPTTREMSVESNSTTESEKAFLFEMEQTMKQLSNQSKIILEKSLDQSNFDKNLSIITNQRLHSVLNPFNEVIAELEKKQARSRSITEKNIKSPSPPLPPPEYEFDYYGDDPDPPYYRRHFEMTQSHMENSSPDISESFNTPFYHSTPMKGSERVQSTPNLNVFKKGDEDILYPKVCPQDELRSSMQHVPLKNEFKPVGILGSKSQGLSGSGSSKGVHFCPIVAEVSWRETSYSEDSNNDVSSNSSYSSGYDPPPKSFSSGTNVNSALMNDPHYVNVRKDFELQASVAPRSAECINIVNSTQQQKNSNKVVVGSTMERPYTVDNNKRARGAETQSASRISSKEIDVRSACVVRPPNTPNQPLASDCINNNNMEKNPNTLQPPTKQTRSKFGGFLSRFANFRFSTRKSSNNKKSEENSGNSKLDKGRGVVNSKSGANPNNCKSSGVNAVLSSVVHDKNNKNLEKTNKVNGSSGGGHNNNRSSESVPAPQLVGGVKKNTINEGRKDNENFIYIPLKPALGLPPLPPGRSPRSPTSTGISPTSPNQDTKPTNHFDEEHDLNFDREYRKGGITTDFPVEEIGLLETDLDTETTRTVHLVGGRARSLLQLPPPAPVARSHKSMEYLLDKDNLKCVEPPENDLQKNSSDKVLSEHQLRVQRSLQKLNLPEWYKNSPLPREGFLLKKRGSDASPSHGWAAHLSSGLNEKTTSLGSLGGQSVGANSLLTHSQGTTRSPLSLAPQSSYSFTRWSTSRLNSAQTSPCSSARSSVRSGPSTPPSPLGGARPSLRPTRQPYLGWRSQERLATPRTPHERLAVSLLPQSPPVPSNVSAEIQSSIKEVTNAIVHYVSTSNEPGKPQDLSNSANNRGSPRLWLESSFVGTKPLESPQTPIVVQPTSANVPPVSQTVSSLGHSQTQSVRPLQLDLPLSNGGGTIASTTYQHGEYITTLT